MDLLKRRRDELDWNDWLMMPRWFDWTDSLRRMPTDAMRVEEYEHDGELVIKAEMPGIDPAKDVEITMTNHTLRIKAERRQETTVDENESFHTEFRYGSFTRLVELPVAHAVVVLGVGQRQASGQPNAISAPRIITAAIQRSTVEAHDGIICDRPCLAKPASVEEIVAMIERETGGAAKAP